MTELAPGRDAVFIAAGRYRRHSYGGNHPLGIPRVSLTYDLIKAFGAITDAEYVVSRLASDEELLGFHTREYLDAFRMSQREQKVSHETRQIHNLGTLENPYFPDFFDTPATATGGSIQAAEFALQGRVAFSPAGGMHHAMPDRAQGFCFFNDPALAVQRLRQEGLKVLYVDIDAHHGDGVEFAFRNEPGVVTLSFHMDTDYAYPFKGGNWCDWGELGNAVNVPLPKGCNDTEYRWVFGEIWARVLASFAPQAVVLQAGTDILFPDPLGKFQISTQQFLAIVQQIRDASPIAGPNQPRLAVLGGGGYHPLSVARCWAGVWGILSGRSLPAEIPVTGQQLLRQVGWDQDEDEDYFEDLFVTRFDPGYEGEIRDQTRHVVAQLLRAHPLLRGER